MEKLFIAVGNNDKVILGAKNQAAFKSRAALGRSIGQNYRGKPKPAFDVIEFTINDIKRGKSENWNDEVEQSVLSENQAIPVLGLKD